MSRINKILTPNNIEISQAHSLNEGQKELKSTFNKYMGNPIIESLSSKIK